MDYSVVNDELETLSNYCKDNSLKLNSSKTKAMLFFQDLPPSSPLVLDNSSINFVLDFKFVGLKVDSLLTFKDHVQHVLNKLTSVIFLICKCRKFLDRPTLMLLSSALGSSHISYASVVYLHNCTKRLFNQIASRYVDCGRAILADKRGSSRTATLTRLSWYPLDTLLTFNMYVILFKIWNVKQPLSLYNVLLPPAHDHLTRFAATNSFFREHVQSKMGKLAFKHWAATLWNNLPPLIRSLRTITSFRKSLHVHLTNAK